MEENQKPVDAYVLAVVQLKEAATRHLLADTVKRLEGLEVLSERAKILRRRWDRMASEADTWGYLASVLRRGSA